jgi:hypothetical protein
MARGGEKENWYQFIFPKESLNAYQLFFSQGFAKQAKRPPDRPEQESKAAPVLPQKKMANAP